MMHRRLIFKLALCGALFAACVAFAGAPAEAQCAMCRTALSNSPETAKLAQNFNYAVLVLLIPPVLLFCGIFVAAYKFRKAPGPSSAEETEHRGSRGRWLDKLSARLRRRAQRRDEQERRARFSF